MENRGCLIVSVLLLIVFFCIPIPKFPLESKFFGIAVISFLGALGITKKDGSLDERFTVQNGCLSRLIQLLIALVFFCVSMLVMHIKGTL